MKVADFLEARRKNWQQLDGLCAQMEHKRWRQLETGEIARFAALYRAACADLALADAYHSVERGECDILLTGGSEATITEAALAGFCANQALSK